MNVQIYQDIILVSLPVLWPHFVKLINTYNTTICQNHCSSFKVKLTLEQQKVKEIRQVFQTKDSAQKRFQDQKLTELLSLITEAVRPAADEPFPEV